MMTTLQEQPKVAAPALPSILSRLEQIRFKVDLVLPAMSPSLLESRLVITREFEFEPRPEELQSIVKLAGDRASASLCDEFPVRLLVARILAAQLQREFWDSARLDGAALSLWSGFAPQMLETLSVFRSELDSIRKGERDVSSKEQELLTQFGSALMPDEEPLLACKLLAPRLVRLADAVTTGEALAAAPGLCEKETRLFRAASSGEEAGSRPCLDAIAMRTVLDDELLVWGQYNSIGESDRREAFKEQAEIRFKLLEQAYRYVSDRLQQRQNVAIAAKLDAFAEEMAAARSELFASYRKLATIVRQGGPTPEDEEAALRLTAAREAMIQRVVEAEANEETRKAESTDEVLLDAMKQLKTPETEQVGALDESVEELKREKRRMALLSGITAVLAVAAIAVQWMLPSGAPDAIRVSTIDFNPNARVEQVHSIGPMLYSRVSDWSDMTPARRVEKINEIGGVAARKGFGVVFIVDGMGKEVASWSPDGGAQIR